MQYQFPDGFMWGAATAAHQVEGNNTNSDFWLMEHLEGTTFAEPSEDAANHYHLYREDIALVSKLGMNAYRFSIEWARIEPADGVFDEEAIHHYRDVLLACKEYNLTPIVTLHHFSSPQWLIQAGGWESVDTPARFARYCARVMRELGHLIPYICTINEANIAIGINKIVKQSEAGVAQVGIRTAAKERMQKYFAELSKSFGMPYDEIHPFLAPRSDFGLKVIFQSHVEARKAIREVSPSTLIGLTLSLFDIQSVPGGEENAADALEKEFLQFLPYLHEDDFLGLQNYTREIYGPAGVLPIPEGAEKTEMGYEFYPEALESVIRYAWKYLEKPILITENGVATDRDERRVEFINRALKGVHSCTSDGIPVKGYMHWSLLDNFEWHLGFSKRFGLIQVDRATQKRTPKPSAYHYGRIIGKSVL